MRIHIVSVAGKVPAWVDSGYAEYAKRLRSALPLSLIEIKPANRLRGDLEDWRKDEWQRLLAVVPKGAGLVALDEKGRGWSSLDFAKRLEHWREAWNDLALLIGGPDGLDPQGVESVNAVWSLSPLTLPHALVRIILVEQLYRGWTLLQGHPYHRI